jgi:hypothetical protein
MGAQAVAADIFHPRHPNYGQWFALQKSGGSAFD